MMSDVAIRAQGLSKQYAIGSKQGQRSGFRARIVGSHQQESDTIWALRDVSFEVKQGEVLGVIGRNGSGKSTLLKILSRITKPTKGEADIHGRVGSLLEVGTGFHPELTGRENIRLNGALLGLKKAEIDRHFDAIVEFAEIERFLDTPVKRYSSGMYMRLAFAVAAHLKADILLVDEVLAVGDAAFQKKCLGKIGTVSREGRTILFVSHNMAAIRTLCSKAILHESGRSVLQGPTESIISAYLSEADSDLPSTVRLPRGEEGAAGFAVSLQIVSRSGVPKTNFRIGEPWRLVLELDMLKPTTSVVVGLGLVSVDAIPLITYWSGAKDLTSGRYKVEFECDLPLAQCSVRFNVGLSSQERPFYYATDQGLISISNVAELEQPFRASGSGFLLSAMRPKIVPVASLVYEGHSKLNV